MKKFEFNTWIVETRKMNYSQVLLGLGALAALLYNVVQYVQNNRIEFLEKLIEIFNAFRSSEAFYLVFFVTLAALMIPALYQLFRKKTIPKGSLHFDEEKLSLKTGRQRFEIPESHLKELRFELKELPKSTPKRIGKKPEKAISKEKVKLKGGNFMTIPMNDGDHKFEFHLSEPEERQELLDLIEFLKIEHDVNVNVTHTK